jgi:hypothetical protein
MSDENKSEQPEQITEEHSKAIEHVIGSLDLSSVSKDDVILDFIGRLRRFNFEAMVALRLLEKVVISEKSEEAQSAKEE